MVHAQGKDNTPPPGFAAMFNGKDLTGWQALMELRPQVWRRTGPGRELKVAAEERAANQRESNAKYLPHWSVRDGVFHYDGKGQSAERQGLRRFRIVVDWRIPAKADSGIYLRGSPQIQIWDPPGADRAACSTTRRTRKPIKAADQPIGEWNTFRVVMKAKRSPYGSMASWS